MHFGSGLNWTPDQINEPRAVACSPYGQSSVTSLNGQNQNAPNTVSNCPKVRAQFFVFVADFWLRENSNKLRYCFCRQNNSTKTKNEKSDKPLEIRNSKTRNMSSSSSTASATGSDTIMWVEKYRPNNLDELIAHEQIISTSMCFHKFFVAPCFQSFNFSVLQTTFHSHHHTTTPLTHNSHTQRKQHSQKAPGCQQTSPPVALRSSRYR